MWVSAEVVYNKFTSLTCEKPDVEHQLQTPHDGERARERYCFRNYTYTSQHTPIIYWLSYYLYDLDVKMIKMSMDIRDDNIQKVIKIFVGFNFNWHYVEPRKLDNKVNICKTVARCLMMRGPEAPFTNMV